MLSNTILLAALAAVAAASPAVPKIEFEYYPAGDSSCSSSSLSAVSVSQAATCYDLSHPALSFHVGGPSGDQQVPKGCSIVGYSEAKCAGSVNLQVQGKSSDAKCYVVGTNMQKKNPVRSVQLSCS